MAALLLVAAVAAVARLADAHAPPLPALDHSHADQIFTPSLRADGGPEQLHVAFGATPDAMRISWLTNATGATSLVRFGTVNGSLTLSATGPAGATYTCAPYTSGAIHIVELTGLAPSTTYFYIVGDDATGTSRVRSFKSSPGVGLLWPYTFAAIGDLGQTNFSRDTTLHVLASKIAHSAFITGDLSYADSDQPRWDSFQRLVDPMTSSMPVMVASGNHEIDGLCLYTAYLARYNSMPAPKGSPDGPMYYSYEAAGAHVIILASFFVYSEGSAQYTWLAADLAAIDRAKTPWVIVLLHAPWYTSNTVHPTDGQLMRDTLEPMLHAAKVNIVFGGHVHAYERSFPVYNNALDAAGSVYITIGDGGNREGLYTNWASPQPVWSAHRQAEYGHGELTLVNASVATWVWIRNVDNEPVATDSATFVNILGL